MIRRPADVVGELERVEPTVPREQHAACKCGVFVAECLVPVVGSDAAEPACWICAHDHVAHGRELGTSSTPCECPRSEIFPPDVIARRDGAAA